MGISYCASDAVISLRSSGKRFILMEAGNLWAVGPNAGDDIEK